MMLRCVMRSMVVLGLLSVGGCVGAPTALPPPPPGSVLLGTQCFAGFYVCQLPAPGPVGTQCSCPGLGAPSFGSIR